MSDKLILIDGSSVLSSCFYGTLPEEWFKYKEDDRKKLYGKILQTSSGVYTNAVYGMTKILLGIISRQKPTHIAIAWDVSRETTFRRKLYPLYKANRPETPEPLKTQFAVMQKVLEAMNVFQFRHPIYEADDIIGTLANKFEKGAGTFILSKDHDVIQLCNDYTRIWLITSKWRDMYEQVGLKAKELNVPDGVFELTPEYAKYHFSLDYPAQIIDRKALEGDSSDNIPGVKNVGEKSVIPLLHEYGTVDNLYKAIDGLDKKEEDELKLFWKEFLGVKRSPLKSLLETSATELVGKESAMLSKKLATIVTDIPDLRDLPFASLKLKINFPKMASIFAELEFKSLLERELLLAK